MHFCQVGLLLYLVSASLGLSWGCFSQVTSETWHQTCQGNVFFSVLSHWSKDLKWWVTAQGFIRQAKDSTPSRCDGRHTPKEKPQSVLASFFYVCLFSTLSLPHANWASQEGGMFVSPEVLTLVRGFSFFLLSQAFLYLCLLATAILDPFSYSNYLTEILTW